MTGIRLNDLPCNENGRLTREALAEAIGITRWIKEKKLFACIYSGGRDGNSSVFLEEAEILSKGIENKGWIAVNGGGNKGLMGAATRYCSNKICFTPLLFAQGDSLHGSNEGLNDSAINIVVPDFYERKAGMDVLSDIFFVLPGGFGSIDESLESVIFAAKNKKPVVFVNVGGYWDNMKGLLQKFEKTGLMPKGYIKNVHFADSSTEALSVGCALLRKRGLHAETEAKSAKCALSTRKLLAEGNGVLSAFLENINSFSAGSPRIGVIASGNIGTDNTKYNFLDLNKRKEIAGYAAKMGADLASQNSVAVIIGDKEGLRETFAENHRNKGGRILWVEQGSVFTPLQLTEISDRERKVVVPRHYETDRLAGLLCQSILSISGGIHTADRLVGLVTRAQTGHGGFSDLLPSELRDRAAPRPQFFCLDPLLGNGETLWASLQKQIAVCMEKGFIPEKDGNVLNFRETAENLVSSAVQAAQNPKDMVAALLDATKSDAPSPPPKLPGSCASPSPAP